jgi:uncharacterized phage protein (TIGR02216 family)
VPASEGSCTRPNPSPLPLSQGRGDYFTDAAAGLAGLAGALLGWRPDEFWRVTPAELAAVLAAIAGPREAGVTRGELAGLMERFPDRP